VLAAAHDLSDGGLAQTLVEGCLRYGVGAAVSVESVCARDGVSVFVALFAESTARVVAAVRPADEDRFTGLLAGHQVATARLGVTGGAQLELTGLFTVPLDEVRAVHEAPLRAVFGG
jgi:phosphoribosylformylglycinamidine synthase